jgi:hypothetical protein
MSESSTFIFTVTNRVTNDNVVKAQNEVFTDLNEKQ